MIAIAIPAGSSPLGWCRLPPLRATISKIEPSGYRHRAGKRISCIDGPTTLAGDSRAGNDLHELSHVGALRRTPTFHWTITTITRTVDSIEGRGHANCVVFLGNTALD